MSALLLIGVLFLLCVWLIVSGIRDMTRGFRRQRPVTNNRTNVHIHIENSFNRRVPHGNRETDTSDPVFGFDSESNDAFTGTYKRW